MTTRMQQEAEAARRLTRIELDLRVAIRNDDEPGVLKHYAAYARAGGCYTLKQIEIQEGVREDDGKD